MDGVQHRQQVLAEYSKDSLGETEMKDRIYVCTTFYHVYISCLKELTGVYPPGGQAAMVLSRMFLDFGDLKTRLEASGIFAEVFEYDEKNGFSKYIGSTYCHI
jgi:hypothetical protein